MSKKERTFGRLEDMAGVSADLKQTKKTVEPVKRKSAKPVNKSLDTETKSVSKSEKTKKKTTEKHVTKAPPKKEDERKACTTAQVMKLVERSADVNPVLLAGKSRVPSQLRGKESLTKIMRRDLGEEFHDSEDTVVVNITELAIEYEVPIVLDRFNACSCDKCVEVLSRRMAERVPVRFARVNKAGRDMDNRELSERVAPMRKMVLTEMIKELIGTKKRCFHDDTE